MKRLYHTRDVSVAIGARGLLIDSGYSGLLVQPDHLKGVKRGKITGFSYASANNIAGVPNFFKFVSIPASAPEEKRRALTIDEQNMIINTPHDAQLPAMIMMFAGLRRGEVIPLEWSDIDLKKGKTLPAGS